MTKPGLSSINTAVSACSTSLRVMGTDGLISARSNANLRIRASISCADKPPLICTLATVFDASSFAEYFMGLSFGRGLWNSHCHPAGNPTPFTTHRHQRRSTLCDSLPVTACTGGKARVCLARRAVGGFFFHAFSFVFFALRG